MNANSISIELEKVLLRHRAGLLTEGQARQETAILREMLRAYEQTEIEDRLEKLEQVLSIRRT